MQKNIKEIIPGSGLGAIKFGMTRDEVIKIAGKPDDVENLPGFEEEISDTLESSLVFDADYEWRLVSIAVSDPYFTYNGVSIVGMDKQDVMDMLEKNNIEISGMEDVSDEENPNLELVESDEEGLMIWFENDEAIEIQILPDVEEDGETLIWPA